MISEYERLEQLAYKNHILLLVKSMPKNVAGFYYANRSNKIKAITLNSMLTTTAQKTCTLAEELAHHFTTPVDLMSAPKYYKTNMRKWRGSKLSSA